MTFYNFKNTKKLINQIRFHDSIPEVYNTQNLLSTNPEHIWDSTSCQQLHRVCSYSDRQHKDCWVWFPEFRHMYRKDTLKCIRNHFWAFYNHSLFLGYNEKRDLVRWEKYRTGTWHVDLCCLNWKHGEIFNSGNQPEISTKHWNNLYTKIKLIIYQVIMQYILELLFRSHNIFIWIENLIFEINLRNWNNLN